ncbi:hypothetical protein CMV24_26780 [Pseudomonas plecoglossicida]|uniref:Uncharacterized protein n=1 Tax=Pseudomonas plecoglossicida TaxID=70775 RepID=A0A2A3LXB4_PSEDL|nr:hypothetical protein CMV24_26780 [Pseudomonas plecoglossicida]RFQ00417.1 hypothetical protein D0O09_18570 [Pseudomonas putida]
MEGQLFNCWNFSGREQAVAMLNEQHTQGFQVEGALNSIREQFVAKQSDQICLQTLFYQVAVYLVPGTTIDPFSLLHRRFIFINVTTLISHSLSYFDAGFSVAGSMHIITVGTFILLNPVQSNSVKVNGRLINSYFGVAHV